jgi:predicted GIY-YIG superfamily endonuclease
MPAARWSVYVLASEACTRTYVGIAIDVEQRLRQHNGEHPGGAKSTRAGRPWALARVFGPFVLRGKAQRIEAAIKRLRGATRLHEPTVASVVRRAGRTR